VPDSQADVRVSSLTKTFVVPEREAGLRAALGSLFHRSTREVSAVDKISFEIMPGEVVGFLGPNGAGKTTTLKMLTGLLYPTSGEARVLGALERRIAPKDRVGIRGGLSREARIHVLEVHDPKLVLAAYYQGEPALLSGTYASDTWHYADSIIALAAQIAAGKGPTAP